MSIDNYKNQIMQIEKENYELGEKFYRKNLSEFIIIGGIIVNIFFINRILVKNIQYKGLIIFLLLFSMIYLSTYGVLYGGKFKTNYIEVRVRQTLYNIKNKQVLELKKDDQEYALIYGGKKLRPIDPRAIIKITIVNEIYYFKNVFKEYVLIANQEEGQKIANKCKKRVQRKTRKVNKDYEYSQEIEEIVGKYNEKKIRLEYIFRLSFGIFAGILYGIVHNMV